jgi:hypothetical protein
VSAVFRSTISDKEVPDTVTPWVNKILSAIETGMVAIIEPEVRGKMRNNVRMLALC